MAEVVREALEVVHHHPGRLRVRAEAFRAGGSLADQVREAILAMPGVTRFEHGVRTGSILIEYEPGLTEPDTILAASRRGGGHRAVRQGCACAGTHPRAARRRRGTGAQ